MTGLQDILKSSCAGRSGDDNIEISPELSAAMAKCQTSMEFQVKHSSVPLGRPADWPPSQVLSFLAESGVQVGPGPTPKVLVRVAEELLEFKKKMLWICSNMPDDEEARRRGSRELFGQEVDSDEEASVLVTSPLTPDFDPTALPRANMGLASVVLAGCAGVEKGAGATGGDAAGELTSLLRELVGRLDEDRDAVYAVQDVEQQSAVWLQLLDVHDMNGTPCVVVKALWCRRREMIGERFEVMMDMISAAQVPGGCGIVNLETSEGAVELLRSVLRRNRAKLRASLTKSQEAQWPKGFKYSVLVAVADMGARRCPICSVLATKVCSRCKQTSYCSVEHQKAHWKTHKKECCADPKT